MKAIDTNVLVRFLVGDDPRQAQAARHLIETTPVWLPKTVVLETEWVLRHAYGFGPEAVIGALVRFCGLPQVAVEDEDAVAQALTWSAAGLDLADALRLASSPAAEAFCTFDRKLATRARRAGAISVEAL